MIATITMMSQPQSRYSNSASAPLPRIPRRPSLPSSPSCPLPVRKDDSPPTRRVRGQPELATPPPATESTPRAAAARPLLYTPGMPLRLSVDSLRSSRSDNSPVSSVSGSKSASAIFDSYASAEAKLIRKKSGQVVRSSLKSSRSASTSGRSLSVHTFTTPSSSSKSEPTTPTSKAVHFDAKLEHVKLFLAEQKPLAVSRDGSPTDDTSGTDSDFPTFIYGDDGLPKKSKLVMQLPNMPQRPSGSLPNPSTDVALEELSLSPDGTSILGKILVRNVAFSKAVFVRFTFDHWHTTSEVSAQWSSSINADWDRFTFMIKLNDLLARIQGKVMMAAVRYCVAGREVWDNNGGGNYIATFSKVKVQPPVVVLQPQPRAALSDDDTSNLTSKLEVVAGNRKRTPSPAQDANTFAHRYDFANSFKSPWKPGPAAATESGRVGPAAMHTRTHSFPMRGATSPPTHAPIPWPTRGPATLGSPRDMGDRDVFHDHSEVSPAAPAPVVRNQYGYFDIAISPRRISPLGTPRSPMEFADERSGSGAFSPVTPVSGTRYHSFPPVMPVPLSPAGPISPLALGSVVPAGSLLAVPVHGGGGGGSDTSTSSNLSTPSSSRSASPMEEAALIKSAAASVGLGLGMPVEEEGEMMNPDTHYRQFLNKFCFFTGPGTGPSPPTVGVTPATPPTSSSSSASTSSPSPKRAFAANPRLPSTHADMHVFPLARTHSESDIEEYRLASSGGGVLDAGLAMLPMRSSSYDDLAVSHFVAISPSSSVVHSRSGSVTPTLASAGQR